MSKIGCGRARDGQFYGARVAEREVAVDPYGAARSGGQSARHLWHEILKSDDAAVDCHRAAVIKAVDRDIARAAVDGDGVLVDERRSAAAQDTACGVDRY